MAKDDKKPKAAPTTGSQAILEAIQSGDLSALGIAPAGTKRGTIGAPEEVLARNPNLPLDFVPWLDGDEWEPQSFSPDAQAKLKAYMANAGLYSDDGYRTGGWDRNDANALTQVLEYANGKGISDIATAARDFASFSQTMGPSAKKPRAPLVNRLTNPASVRQVVRQTSLNLTGRRLSPEEEERIVRGFQAQESAYNQAEYAAENPEGGGGTVTGPMSAESYAAAQLENAPGAGAQRYLGAFEEIHKSLTGTITEGPRLNKQTGEVSYG